MNFTNALLVCLVTTQLPDGAIRTAWAAIAAYMLLHVALRAGWHSLLEINDRRGI